MNFLALTLFPELFGPFWETGIVGRAVENGIIRGWAIDIRDFAGGRHRVVDDRPYGGGCGMVMQPGPLDKALAEAKSRLPGAAIVLLTPRGRPFSQQMAEVLAGTARDLILICGRYEGIDQRVIDRHVELEISIGDYVLTGGELAAMVVMDAVTRLLPGALGNQASAASDSFSQELLEHAQYTRPSNWQGEEVPQVLLSGHHRQIETWRKSHALATTLLKRPDLLRKRNLDRQEIRLLEDWRLEIERILDAQPLRGLDPSPGGG